jgi:hypothetical protein
MPAVLALNLRALISLVETYIKPKCYFPILNALIELYLISLYLRKLFVASKLVIL